MTQEEMRKWLESYGYIVGARNPRRNTDFTGAFMVAEPCDESEMPTKDASNGPWCLVGDDLGELIRETYEMNMDPA